MAITHERIIEGCLHILENAGFHITAQRQKRRFLTAYQIYEILAQEGSPLCQELIDEVKGDFRGKGAHHHDGEYDGQVKRIAQSLRGHPEVETQYLDTRFLGIGEHTTSGADCGIFRLKN
jgi:hypothetical protein